MLWQTSVEFVGLDVGHAAANRRLATADTSIIWHVRVRLNFKLAFQSKVCYTK